MAPSFLLFVSGLFLGSFLGVLIDRIPQGKTVIKGRSECDFCKKELGWYELIPVLSFIVQKGKCRNCNRRLSYFYPIIELLTGVLFAVVYIFSGFQLPDIFFYLFIISALIVVFFTDLKYGIIPDKIIFPSIIVTFVWLLIFNNSELLINLIAAIGSSLFLILISSVYYLIRKKESMGGGDVKFAFFMGLLLGFPGIVIGFYIAFLTAAAVSIILILWTKLKLRDSIPFGPFLALGTALTLFLRDEIQRIVLPYFGL